MSHVNQPSDQKSASRDSSVGERPIGIVAAFPWEVKPLLRRCAPDPAHPSISGAPSSQVHALRLAGKPFLLAVAGAGAENSFRSAEHLAANYPLRGLVTLGFAGGLAAGLKVADLILADRVVDQ